MPEVRELEEAKAREELLSGELLHCSKNTLAIVSVSPASLTRRRATSTIFLMFAARIEALSSATDLLAGKHGGTAQRQGLIEHAIALFRTEGNFRLEGPACEIPETSCISAHPGAARAVHQRCQVGAPTAPGGTVSLTWAIDDRRAAPGSGPSKAASTVVADGRIGMGSTSPRAQMGLRTVDLQLLPRGPNA